jgi:predicted GH43/DUF377 family glycosyl hydrolase
MAVNVVHDTVLLRPGDIEPLDSNFQVVGVFNPSAVRFGDEIILLVRVAESPITNSDRVLLSPRAEINRGGIRFVTDEFDPTGVDTLDPRKFCLPNGLIRLRYISHLRLVRLDADGQTVKEISIIQDLLPHTEWEESGIEDARITRIGDVYYITYVAVSRTRGIATALMSTRNFQTYHRHGIIFPTENKDVVLLPDKWQGNFVAYHRPVSDQAINPPSIETALSPDLVYWGNYQYLFGPSDHAWESKKVGAGPPPLRLSQGWLLLYHGVSPETVESPAGRYCVGACLLDLDNPLHILARSTQPILCPERDYEIHGYVPNVIFPTGAILSQDEQSIMLYTGAADQVTALLEIPTRSVLQNLE